MDYIWNQEVLWALLKHRSEDVQAWAALRLLELYPQTAEELLRLLPQLAPYTASSILSYESHRDCPPELMTFFQQTREPHLKAGAAALLIRFGMQLSDTQLTNVNLNSRFNSLADTTAGFDFLRHRYHKPEGESASLLSALALACDGADIFTGFEHATERKERRSLINQYGNVWGCDLASLRPLRRPHQALSALQQALDATAAATPLDEPWKRELCLALDENQRRLQAIAAAAQTRLSKEDDLGPELEVDFLVTCAMILKRDAVCRTQLVKAQEVEDLWQALVMRPWRLAVSPSLAAFFGAIQPQRVVRALRQALDVKHTHVDYAFQILTTLDLPERFDLLMTIFKDKSNKSRVIAAAKALVAEAPLVSRRLLEHFRDPLPEPMDLMILAAMQTPDVEDFFLTHFDHYMRHPWSETFVEILEIIASKRFLEPLMAEWRPGELALSRLITFIATLHDVQDPRLQPMQQEFHERHHKVERLQQQVQKEPEHALQELLTQQAPFSLPLRCTTCGKTYHYELKKIYLTSKRPEDLMIGQVIQCKGCHSIETYELSPAALLPLSAEMIRFGLLAQLRQRQGQDDAQSELPDTPLIAGRPQLMAGGRRFDTIAAAYHHLKQELDKHPTSSEWHRRLANVLRNGDRPDLALPYYYKAIELDPGESESLYNLTEVLVEQGRYREAIPHAEALVQFCREGQMEEDFRRQLFAWLLEQTAVIEQHTGHRIELFLTPSKQEMSALDKGGGQEPAVVYLTSFDLTDADDFEDTYQVFRTGRVPETSRHSPERMRRSGHGQVLTLPEEPIRTIPTHTRQQKVGRNASCPCGSGKKYKKCCGR